MVVGLDKLVPSHWCTAVAASSVGVSTHSLRQELLKPCVHAGICRLCRLAFLDFSYFFTENVWRDFLELSGKMRFGEFSPDIGLEDVSRGASFWSGTSLWQSFCKKAVLYCKWAQACWMWSLYSSAGIEKCVTTSCPVCGTSAIQTLIEKKSDTWMTSLNIWRGCPTVVTQKCHRQQLMMQGRQIQTC